MRSDSAFRLGTVRTTIGSITHCVLASDLRPLNSALAIEPRDEWMVAARYMTLETMALLAKSPQGALTRPPYTGERNKTIGSYTARRVRSEYSSERGVDAMSFDIEWLELTYPADPVAGTGETEPSTAQERACGPRLEAICWPEGPVCPKCEADEASRWNNAPRKMGYRCLRCKARFHILQVIPGMAGMHQRPSVWFRAIFLIDGNDRLSSIALGEQLGLEQKAAWKLGKAVRKSADNPSLVEGILNGPYLGTVVRRTKGRQTRHGASKYPA